MSGATARPQFLGVAERRPGLGIRRGRHRGGLARQLGTSVIAGSQARVGWQSAFPARHSYHPITAARRERVHDVQAAGGRVGIGR